MIKKQNKISDKKSPRPNPGDTHFSITKNAIQSDANGLSLNGYEYRKKKMMKEIQEEEKRENFWDKVNEVDEKINQIGENVLEEVEGAIIVKKGNHQKSPYVVRLLDEYETSFCDPHIQSKSESRCREKNSKEANAYWIKEVERLRRTASEAYKKSATKIYVNLLEKKKKLPKEKRNFSDLALSALRGVFRWIFEFFLSIPLGFLLALQVVLRIIEIINKWAGKGGKVLGKGASVAVEQTIFIIVAIAKGLVVIPIKLITIFFLVLCRLLIIFGSGISFFCRACFEGIKNYFSIFLRRPKHFYKNLAAISALVGIFVFPVKFLSSAPQTMRLMQGKVLGAAKEGFIGLSSLELTEEHLAASREKFSQARENIESLNIFVRAMVSVLPQGQDALHAISAGDDLAQAGILVSQAISPIEKQESESRSPVDFIETMRDTFNQALPYIKSAMSHISSINPENLPNEYKQKFEQAKSALPLVEAAVSDFNSFAHTILSVLGKQGQKRYAVLFQNNNELRPAGGFIGSLAFIDVKDGKIVNMEIPKGGPYDFQGYLTENVYAPKPLQILNARWELQDANWYADWPTSAEKVAWFIEKSSHSSVDGVIAMQATTLVKLLEILGPIDFPEYSVVLDKDNVIDEMQIAVEENYDKQENQPKKYVAELVPRVLEKMLSSGGSQMAQILSLAQKEIFEKNILLYFRDKDVNESFISRGWEPSMLDSDFDYLSVVHANIGGGKTDGVIAQSYDQEIIISEDGTAAAELTIIRQHNGDAGNKFENMNNVDYVRVYVPKGSELISFEGVKPPPASMYESPQSYFIDDKELELIEGKAIIDERSGTRITNEFNKTVFGNWLQVDPQNVLVAKIKYKLPFKIRPFDVFNPEIKSGYSLLLQKQPGARRIPYSISLKYPSSWNISWQKAAGDGNLNVLGPGLVVFEGDLISDTGFGVLFGK